MINHQKRIEEETKQRAQTETTSLIPTRASNYESILFLEKSSSNSKPSQRRILFWLVVSTWTSGILFGIFALLHYLRAFFLLCGFDDDDDDDVENCVQSAWDRSDPNLYRRKNNLANRLMVAHLLAGICLMFGGPVQFLPSIRRNRIHVHRWIGRFYIAAAVVASGCATVWTLIWHTSRCNVHEDIGNLILGTSVFVTAVQTYWNVKIYRRIDLHQLWAWRLYACILGAPLYRLYAALYGGLILYTPWTGNLWVENATFYIIVIPNLAVVQIIWRRKLLRDRLPLPSAKESSNGAENNGSPDELSAFRPLVGSGWIQGATAFIFVTTLLIFVVVWLPTILGADTGVASKAYHDFCTVANA